MKKVEIQSVKRIRNISETNNLMMRFVFAWKFNLLINLSTLFNLMSLVTPSICPIGEHQ